MKTDEQIALEVANTITAPYISDESLTRFAEKFLAAWLEQQSQEPCVRLHITPTYEWPDIRVQVLNGEGFPVEGGVELFLAPQPAIPDWIGVEDRLPEEHQEVMCAFGNGNMLILEFDRSLAPYRFIDRDSGKWWSLKIKHWMPLPNPPAQGEQE